MRAGGQVESESVLFSCHMIFVFVLCSHSIGTMIGMMLKLQLQLFCQLLCVSENERKIYSRMFYCRRHIRSRDSTRCVLLFIRSDSDCLCLLDAMYDAFIFLYFFSYAYCHYTCMLCVNVCVCLFSHSR